MLLFVAFGFTCFFTGLSGDASALATITASGVLVGTTLGCSFTISLAGTSCRECIDIRPAAKTRLAAKAPTLILRTNLRRA
jgi:hypothetical protein